MKTASQWTTDPHALGMLKGAELIAHQDGLLLRDGKLAKVIVVRRHDGRLVAAEESYEANAEVQWQVMYLRAIHSGTLDTAQSILRRYNGLLVGVEDALERAAEQEKAETVRLGE
jgi:hypothetical protein